MEKLLFGIVVLTYNSEGVVVDCIRKLKSALENVPHEIVVVDNASTDHSAEVVRAAFPDVRVLQAEKNLGYARGNNLGGMELADSCSYLAFVNPDVGVERDTMEKMRQVLEEHSDAGCVGGVPLINGKRSRSCFRNKPTFIQKLVLYGTWRDLPILRRLLRNFASQMEKEHFVELTVTQPVYAVSGACLLFAADVYRRIGGFDEHTFLFQEEFIVSERLRRIGYAVYGRPDAVYAHAHGHSVRRRLLHAQRVFIHSEQYLIRTYYGWNWPLRASMLALRYLDWTLHACVVELNKVLKSLPGKRGNPR